MPPPGEMVLAKTYNLKLINSLDLTTTSQEIQRMEDAMMKMQTLENSTEQTSWFL